MERKEEREPLCNLAEYSMNCPKSGFIAHTNFLDEWQGHPRLVYARPLVHQYQRVTGVPTLFSLLGRQPGLSVPFHSWGTFRLRVDQT